MSGFSSTINVNSLTAAQGFSLSESLGTLSNLGSAIAAVGDVDNDGIADFVIGAEGLETAAYGSALLVYGRQQWATGTTDIAQFGGIKIYRGGVESLAGKVVEGVGDVNGDGIDDFAIGSQSARNPSSTSATPAGAAYIVYGTSDRSSIASTTALGSLSGTDGFQLYSSPNGDQFGNAIAGGDLDGDGVSDFLVAAENEGVGNGRTGKVFGHYGQSGFVNDFDVKSLTGPNNAAFTVQGLQAGEKFSTDLSLGDFNGDGNLDTLYSSEFFDSSNASSDSNKGRVFVDLGDGVRDQGATIRSSNSDFNITGAVAGDQLGGTAKFAGDINGDGFDDIVMGAFGNDPFNRLTAGTTYLMFGTDQAQGNVDLASNTSLIEFYGADERDRSGWKVAGVGDVNADGFDDFVTTAIWADSTSTDNKAGEAYLIFGKASGWANTDLGQLSASEGVLIQNSNGGDQLGSAVSGLGDINGDGIDEFGIGASSSRNLATNADNNGIVYVLYGQLPTTAVVRTGSAADQTIRGGALDDTLNGLGGKDKLFGNAGQDILNGGDGDDELYGGDNDDRLNGGANNDKLFGSFGIDLLNGNAGNDELFGEDGDDNLAGEAGDDTLWGWQGEDDMFGGAGADEMHGQQDNDTMYGGTENDTMFGDGGNDTMFGEGDNDTMFGWVGNDEMYGNDGDDQIFGQDGEDRLFGWTGTDTIEGGQGNDLLLGDAGADTLRGC